MYVNLATIGFVVAPFRQTVVTASLIFSDSCHCCHFKGCIRGFHCCIRCNHCCCCRYSRCCQYSRCCRLRCLLLLLSFPVVDPPDPTDACPCGGSIYIIFTTLSYRSCLCGGVSRRVVLWPTRSVKILICAFFHSMILYALENDTLRFWYKPVNILIYTRQYSG